MRCTTITAVEIAGKEYPAGVEIDIPENVYAKLASRGAVKAIEIDFNTTEVPAAQVHVEAHAPLPTKVEQARRFTLGRKKR